MIHEALSKTVIGAAMQVHRTLGPGFLEAVYEKALGIELSEAGLPFESQKKIEVRYRGLVVGDFIADLLVGETLLVELKAAQNLAEIHEVQLVNYLTATGLPTGLLFNFGAASLQFKRKFKDAKYA